MRRRPAEVMKAWLQLLPVALRLTIRRVRHLHLGRRPTVDMVTADSSVGRVSVAVGTDCPILVGDGVTAGLLSTRDDGGSSSAETVVSMSPDIDPDAARALFVAISEAAVARGNNRTSVNACEDDLAALAGLAAAGFTHEGRAAPPWGDTRSWTVWSRLRSEVTAGPPHPAR